MPEYIKLLAEQIQGIVFYIEADENRKETVHYVSEKVQSLLGYKAYEFTSNLEQWDDIIHPDDKDTFMANKSKMFKDKKGICQFYRISHKVGNTFVWIKDDITFLPSTEKETTEYIRIVQYYSKVDETIPQPVRDDLVQIALELGEEGGKKELNLFGRFFGVTDDATKKINEKRKKFQEEGKKLKGWFWRHTTFPYIVFTDWFKNIFYTDIKTSLGDHEKVSRVVFRRLLLRYKQLSILTGLTGEQLENAIDVNELPRETKVIYKKNINDIKQNNNAVNDIFSSGNAKLQIYKHAITDLFVEKAITYLEIQASKYKSWGNSAYILGLVLIIFATVLSAKMYLHRSNLDIEYDIPFKVSLVDAPNNHRKETISYDITDYKNKDTSFSGRKIVRDYDPKTSFIVLSDTGKNKINYEPAAWYTITERFILGFTFYGFLVLLTVGLWRFGRAMLDQAERLLERRHALRQGRLFVHLHNGDLTIDDMEKAFNWNVSQPNAFSHMATDAKAPWGVVLSEAIKAGSEIAKSTKSAKDKATKEG